MPHETRADYYYAFAGELFEGDGLRLLPAPGRPVPVVLFESLVATHVERDVAAATVTFTVIPRSIMVERVLHVLQPTGDASVPEPVTLTYSADDVLLVRY